MKLPSTSKREAIKVNNLTTYVTHRRACRPPAEKPVVAGTVFARTVPVALSPQPPRGDIRVGYPSPHPGFRRDVINLNQCGRELGRKSGAYIYASQACQALLTSKMPSLM